MLLIPKAGTLFITIVNRISVIIRITIPVYTIYSSWESQGKHFFYIIINFLLLLQQPSYVDNLMLLRFCIHQQLYPLQD